MTAVRRMAAVVAVGALALGAVGCSSDGDEAATDDATSTASAALIERADLEAAATRIADQWGARDGFAVTVIALDRGYSVDQLLDATAIDEDGTVPGTEPEDSDAGLVELAAAGATDALGTPTLALAGIGLAALPAQEGGPTVADATVAFLDESLGEIFDAGVAHLEALEAAEEAEAQREEIIIDITLSLAARGYSVEQIIEAMWFGTIRADTNVGGCPAIVEDPDQMGPVDPIPTPPGSDRLTPRCPPVDTADPADATDDDGGSDPGDADDGGNDPAEAPAADGTALQRLAPGTYQGTIDTAGAFRDGVAVTTADITLTIDDDGAAVDWTVEWSEPNEECTTTGVDWFSGAEVTNDTDTSFSIRGDRSFRPGADSTCDLGAEPSSFERTLRLDVDGTTVTADVGVGIATIDVSG